MKLFPNTDYGKVLGLQYVVSVGAIRGEQPATIHYLDYGYQDKTFEF